MSRKFSAETSVTVFGTHPRRTGRDASEAFAVLGRDGQSASTAEEGCSGKVRIGHDTATVEPKMIVEIRP